MGRFGTLPLLLGFWLALVGCGTTGEPMAGVDATDADPGVDAVGVPCSALDPLALPVADVQNGPMQVSQTVKFVMLPGLEAEQEQFYTIVARGELVDGTPVAFGCNATDGHVLISSSKYVTIALEAF